MPPRLALNYTQARSPLLRWLTDVGPDVPSYIREPLLSELFAAPKAVLLGVIAGLMFNISAQCLHGGNLFLVFIAIDLALAAARLLIVRHAAVASAQGKPTPTDLYLVTAISWCALQGAMCFSAMRIGNPILQVLAATTALGLIGPICARNYPAPRYALLLACLCDLPFVFGGLLSGNLWMLVIAAQTPLLIFGCLMIIRRLHGMSLSLLRAQHESQLRSERDPLTGLLNRSGLATALAALQAADTPFVLFYIDLDGFKAVNDSFGHPAGDALLQAVARRLQACTRAADIIARLGGDEFAVVAPDLQACHSERLADGVVRAITDQEYGVGPAVTARIGVSVGFACSPDDGTTLDDLHGKADAALYCAKRSGKATHKRFVLPPQDLQLRAQSAV